MGSANRLSVVAGRKIDLDNDELDLEHGEINLSLDAA